MNPRDEITAIALVLCMHLRAMVRSARQIPPDRFDWTFAPPAPTPRILVTHAWQWLVCDRQHIEQPDASLHPPVPDPPDDPQALCDVLAAETDRWEALILGLTPEELDAPRFQFNATRRDWNLRGFLWHMVQNSVYKNGQLSTLFFALGLDGTEPYAAPIPNPIYAEAFGPDWPRGS